MSSSVAIRVEGLSHSFGKGALCKQILFDITTEVEARTADLAWGHNVSISEEFSMDLTVGLRFADFKETMDGSYGEVDEFDLGTGPVLASKSNQGEMFGLRLAARGSYRFSRSFSLTASLGFSMLDGELTASSSLIPQGTVGGDPILPNAISVKDDGRSGSIVDVDVALVWNSSSETVKVWLGWEQSTWEGIATDLVRNFPGTIAPLRDRDAVVFSGYKLGVWVGF